MASGRKIGTPSDQQSDAQQMEKEMKNLREKDTIAGSRILPLLHAAGMAIFGGGPVKEIYWAMVGISVVLCFWGVLFGLFCGGLLALLASYKKPTRPDGIPLAPMEFDVMLGRPVKVSTDVEGLVSNNNVTITRFQNSYIVAYRQSDVHFPSGKTRLVVARSSDAVSWDVKWTYANGCDLREMLLFELNGVLMLYFFSLVPAHGAFKPLHVFCTSSTDGSSWGEPREVCYEGEVPWEIKVYGSGASAIAYKSSYLGDHYGTKDVLVLFEQSKDGIVWKPVPPCTSDSRAVYKGGVCEVSFEFTKRGDLVAIGRNEDGDSTGFGTQLFFAKKESLGEWTHLNVSIPWRFDSPRLVPMMDGEILLFARYAPCPYQFAPSWLPFKQQKIINLVSCSLTSKSAAVYRIAPPEDWVDKGTGDGAVQLIRNFEGSAGDTGFFSVVPEFDSSNRWLVANYTSTMCHSHAPWIYGQMGPSQVFVFRCEALKTNP